MMELNIQRMEDFKERFRYLKLFVAGAFLLIFVYLWYLQVIKGSELRQLSENNRIRIREMVADRGMLLDRKGQILAHNRPSFEVFLVPEDIRSNPEVLEKIGEILNLPQEEIGEKVKGVKRRRAFRPGKRNTYIGGDSVARPGCGRQP